jgi:hypothetical protein
MTWTEDRQNELLRIISRVNFCGCGTNRKWTTMRVLLENAETRERPFYDPDDLPETEIGFWEFAYNCMDSFGLMEHGSTMCSSMLTDDGHMLLDFLREFPDGRYPEWAADSI